MQRDSDMPLALSYLGTFILVKRNMSESILPMLP